MLVDVLLVVGDQGLGDGLTDGVDLRSVTTTGDADADVNWVCVSGEVRGVGCGAIVFKVRCSGLVIWSWGGTYVPCENLSRPRMRRGS